MSWSVYLKDMGFAPVDITGLVTIKHTRRLSRPCSVELIGQAEELVFTQVAGGPYGAGFTQVMLYENATLRFNGRIMNVQYDGDELDATVTITAWDPMWYFTKRWTQDFDGDFSKPSIIENNMYAPLIMHAALYNTVFGDAGQGPIGLENHPDGPESSDVNVTGYVADWPMTMDGLRQMLLSTGKLDCVIEPIDGLADGAVYDSTMGWFRTYAGSYGTDLSGSVTMAWGAAPYNIKTIQWSKSMDTVTNALWYFLGPKCDQQHWRGNVTKDDRSMPGNPGVPGQPVPPPGVGSYPGTLLGDKLITSRTLFFYLQDIKIFDDLGGDCWDLSKNGWDGFGENAYRPIYQLLWQNEAWLRVYPRNMVTWEPVEDLVLPFDIGDLITVEAGARLGGGFSGAQRVYEYTQDIDVNGTVITSSVVTSRDQET